MDKILHTPDADGYSFTDGLEAVRSQQDSGMGRYRRTQLNSMVGLNVQWTCGVEQYEALRANYRQHVEEGHAPFPIDLLIDTATLEEFQVKIRPGSFQLTSVSGITLTVGAVLEVPLPPAATATGDPAKLTLVPDQDGYGFADQSEAIFQALDGGPSRSRRDKLGVSTIVNVQWKTTAAGYLYLRNYYRSWTTNPVPFLMDVLLDSTTLTEQSCMFVPASMGLQSQAGNLYVVKAQLEVMLVPAEAAGCDCSTTAWQTNFEPGGADRGGITQYIGGSNFEFFRDPLYGINSVWWGAEDSDEIYLSDPQVSVDGDWTIESSFKIQETALTEVLNWNMFDVWEPSAGKSLRIWVNEYDDSGTPKVSLTIFWVPSFSQQTVNGFLYDTKYDIAIVKSATRIRTFMNGVKVNDQSASGHPGIDSIDLMWNESQTVDQPIVWDEIRVSNFARYEEDYTPVLPFCGCPAPPFEIGWMEPATSSDPTTVATTNAGFDDFTGSIGDTILNMGIVGAPDSGSPVSWRIDFVDWTPVNPGDPKPELVFDNDGYGTQQVTPQRDPDTNQMYDGVAIIRANAGGTEATGYLILTIYSGEGMEPGEFTGGYGGIAWAHS